MTTERPTVRGEDGLVLPAVMNAAELRDLLGLSENTAYQRLRVGGDLHWLTISVGGRTVRVSGARVLRLLEGVEESAAPTSADRSS